MIYELLTLLRRPLLSQVAAELLVTLSSSLLVWQARDGHKVHDAQPSHPAVLYQPLGASRGFQSAQSC